MSTQLLISCLLRRGWSVRSGAVFFVVCCCVSGGVCPKPCSAPALSIYLATVIIGRRNNKKRKTEQRGDGIEVSSYLCTTCVCMHTFTEDKSDPVKSIPERPSKCLLL